MCAPRCGSGAGDTGATAGPGCLSRELFYPISLGDMVVWFEGQCCLCNSSTFQSQMAGEDGSLVADLLLYLHP